MPRSVLHACATALLLVTGNTYAECRGLSDLQSSSAAAEELSRLTKTDSSPPTDCGTLASVWHSLMNTGRTGGRKLEEDRPYNASEAQANYAKAQSDPEVRQRLDQVGKEVSNGNLRLLYQAAILDEEGYYSARDMLVRQLRQQLK
ncbi:hypothetical protein D3C78_788270 [compost metagenome]